MKELLAFIKDKGLHTLDTELGISIKEYEGEGLYVLNYSQIDSPKTHPVVMQCRGIILNKDYKPVCRPFDRFFNIGEALNITDKVDLSDSLVTEKVDGSLVKVYKHKGLWYVATRGTAFAESENYTGKTFYNLIMNALGIADKKELTSILDSIVDDNLTLIFEYTSPSNRIVTPYKEDKMILLGARYNTIEGREVGKDGLAVIGSKLQELGLNVRNAKTFALRSQEQVKTFVNSLPALQEGVVCIDNKTGIRVKVKADLYVAVHSIRGNSLPTPKRIIGLIVTNEVDEYLAYFPEDETLFTPYITQFRNMLYEVESDYSKYCKIEDQKEFALSVKDKLWQGLLFSARKLDKSPTKCFFSLDVNKRVKLLSKYIEDAS